MITQENINVDSSEVGFVWIVLVQMMNGVDMGGRFVLERDNVPFVLEQVEKATTSWTFPEVEHKHGADELRLKVMGPEQEPFLNMLNERAASAKHGGTYALAPTVECAKKLVPLLRALRA